MDLWHLKQATGTAEVRRTEKQAEGGRINEDRVCREVMDPGFLMVELLLSAEQEKQH